MFHLVLYKRFNYLTKRLRFWWFSGRNGTTINSNHVLLICLFNDFFKISWKIYLFIFYDFIFIPFSSLGRVNITRRWKKKPLHSLVKLFFFFFFPKIISYHESSARKNENANLSGHVIPAKSDPSNHFSRIKKSTLGLQCV